jgi:hypothetical protein
MRWTYSTPTMSAPAASASAAFGPLRDDEHAHALARAGRQHHGAADDLVGVARVDAEAHRDLDGLVELGDAASLTRSIAWRAW